MGRKNYGSSLNTQTRVRLSPLFILIYNWLIDPGSSHNDADLLTDLVGCTKDVCIRRKMTLFTNLAVHQSVLPWHMSVNNVITLVCTAFNSWLYHFVGQLFMVGPTLTREWKAGVAAPLIDSLPDGGGGDEAVDDDDDDDVDEDDDNNKSRWWRWPWCWL